MVFGYLIVRTLLPLVHLLGRLGWSRRFAATLNAAHRPFHLINYAGSAGGGRLLTPRRMATIMDATITALDRRLARETPASLALTMHFPTRWDRRSSALMAAGSTMFTGPGRCRLGGLGWSRQRWWTAAAAAAVRSA